ncbi:MAG: RagB/SusD family nutrient uptake outer membrane protein [Bacteroidales bacterium]|nr:RagB/SusD family nutrient uptake outer membrane protein [Bacteroidales bacterium]
MKKYIALFSAVLFALSVYSCSEENFDVRSSSRLSGSDAAEIVEADPEFLAAYVNGFYAWMVQYNTQASTGTVHDDYGHLAIGAITDLMGQDIAVNGSWNWGTYDINHDYGQWDWSRPYQLWNFYFTLIKNTNEVIDFFGEEDPTNPVLRSYLGQAYALRAFSYYYLIQLFQDVALGDYPNATFNKEAPAVPIIYAVRDAKTNEEVAARSGRNKIEDLCVEIERNIDLALPLLDGAPRLTKNEVDYNVAQGIAARYYLLSQQWDKAITAATAALEGYTLMDNARLHAGFKEIEDPEVMWGFNHTSETQTTYASFFSHMSNDNYGYGGIGQSVRCIDASLYNQIPVSDYRKSLFNGPDGDSSAPYAGGKLPYAARKFGGDANYLQDYTFMRAAEMYLIIAEAEARKDGTSTTLATLMEKRDPAWSKTADLQEVLLQRRIELWGEGFEYFDLRRLAKGVDRTYTGTNHSAQAQYAFPAHAKSWNFQIPQREIQNNVYITEEEKNEWITGPEEFKTPSQGGEEGGE